MDTIARNYEWKGIASENCHINFKALCAEQLEVCASFVRQYHDLSYGGEHD